MSKQMKTMDGNKAASYVSYAFTEVATIYPITPSSNMAENVDEWSTQGQKNIFGQTVSVTEMQSEAGAAGAMHGSLAAGALTTSYTASQGLLLMIPNMYKMAGELLPGVLHVSARTLATHALSIFGDHSDVMACAQTGFALLASGSVQEVMDIGGVAHLSAVKSSIPFLHFFDGFRTSHEQQKIEVIDYVDFARLLDREALQRFRDNALNPEHPVTRGTNQNPDIFFQAREASQPYIAAVPQIVADYLEQISHLTGRKYNLFDYYGAPDAEHILVAMGSVCETAETAVDALNSRGHKTGLIKVRLYRPFSLEHFLKCVPATVKRIAVLDRVKAPGATGDPLFLDVLSAFYGKPNAPLIIGGRYGLACKDTVPADLIAALQNLMSDKPKHHFTLAINDDVGFTSLPRGPIEDLLPPGTIQCKFWGLGSDGTVGANKQAVDIIGGYTDMYAQAYFSYDSKKSGGLTTSHLRFGKKEIKAPYLINQADFICCSNQAYVNTYDLLEGLKPGSFFLLNCVWDKNELGEKLPDAMKLFLAKNKINFYIINAVKAAKELGLGNRTNMIMQSAFFKLTNILPQEVFVNALYDSIEETYGKKGVKVVEMNRNAVQCGINDVIKVEVPAAWAEIKPAKATDANEPPFVRDILRPMAAGKGDSLPVSAFVGREDGSFPNGGTAWEKRGVAPFVPEWIKENCIQCNQCALFCPHATIRPFLLTEEQLGQAPENFTALKAIGKEFSNLQYRIQVSPLDCQGCGVCVEACPAKEKALIMKPIEEQTELQAANWDYAFALPDPSVLPAPNNIKNSQFHQPLMEFSGACAGCGETPYAKLITQLYGDRMMIGNATGCSSIWAAAVPAMSHTVNQEGKGPAWCNSLFEDNAEFTMGMLLGVKQIRGRLTQLLTKLAEEQIPGAQEWLDAKGDAEAEKAALPALLSALADCAGCGCDCDDLCRQVLELKDFLIKKSFWAFGGDGWAYDIGFGGVDHVLASGEDINLFVYDTEIYSNTGGQSSKATPTAATAKFASGGKRLKKKDLGMMAAAYGYVYVAQIAIGADMNQTLKAIKEAESYPGPSLIIAYSSCINHGIKGGMKNSMVQMKKAVQSGYWHLYRFDPRLKDQGKNPFTLDSKQPAHSLRDFLLSEVRYSSLQAVNPEMAEELFAKTEAEAKERYQGYLNMSKLS
ncbi:MAG: pyruvate:ferredoxin (flavodoxin) oxidoreductase [Clostridiales bacterium]|nr:pyruvate:ferredoxin (flavodoxin) oxidoreductase [Clostridiales bacterium]